MPEKSITQIVAEIKAKIPEIDAQLNAIEVGELPENVKSYWHEAIVAWDDAKGRIDALNVEILNKYWQGILFELRAPLSNVRGYLELIPRVSEAELRDDLPPHIKAKIHEALPHVMSISELLREINDFYRGNIING